MQFQAAHGLLLAGLWLAYFALHSLLASLLVKRALARRWPRAMRGYRLAFNASALLLVLPPVWLTYALEAPYLWRWSGIWAWVANLLALAALIQAGMDSGEFHGRTDAGMLAAALIARKREDPDLPILAITDPMKFWIRLLPPSTIRTATLTVSPMA